FTVPDAVDADVDLLPHAVGDPLRDRGGIDHLAEIKPHRQILQSGRDRQPSGVRGAYPVGAALHAVQSSLILASRRRANSWGPAKSICTKVAFSRSRTGSLLVAASSSCVSRATICGG